MRKKTGYLFIAVCVLLALMTACAVPGGENMAPSASPSASAQETSQDFDGELGASARCLMDYGIIQAGQYTAGSFLSRNVAARLIADVTGLSAQAKDSAFTHPFVDVSGDEEQLIAFLYHYNIVTGVSNNQFMGDEICDTDSFLLFLLKTMDYIGARQEDITPENARDTAVRRGLLSDGADTDGTLSVNAAFDICYNALFVPINDAGQTLLDYLSARGIAKTAGSGDYNSAYQIAGLQAKPFYSEPFEDKKLDGYNIKGPDGTVTWYGSRTKGATNQITNGYLQLSGKDQRMVEDQQFALRKDLMQGNESYGMTFTVNVQSMANEGNEGRVILRVIPRTADEDFTKYYAVNYYMVLPLENYQSNLARCKWSITNTNAPSGTTPLAEAYYLLKEGVDYTARLLIENTADGNVHIAFYIDGADHYDADAAPLLEYTDTSAYKILQSAAGPALGTSGYQDAGWGYASTVRFGDIAFYDTQSFTAQSAQLKAYADTPVLLQQSDEYASQLRYLVDHGVLSSYEKNLNFGGNVSVAQFLASAMYLNGTHMEAGQDLNTFVASAYQAIFKGTDAAEKTDLNREITRDEAALIIADMMPGEPGTARYRALFRDALDKGYENAVFFAVQNSYLLLDADNRFNGTQTLTRQDMIRIFACAVDSRLRDENHVLELPAILSNDAVLQGGKPIPISGKGMSGDTVSVTFNGQTKSAVVADGKWSVELDSQAYGGPYTLTVKDSGYSYSFKSIYVGEVFVVAGQSNAEMSVYESADNADTLRKFNDQTQVRLFRPNSRMAVTPLSDTATKWEVAHDEYSEQILGTASAIGVFCVQELLEINPQLKNVKIGIVQITYGGTSIEMFLPDCVDEKNGLVQKDNEFLESGFWNGYMDGLTPYAAKALIYYQGENSAQLGYMYEPMLRDYIWGVRQKFDDPSLPILLVQLSGYGDNYGQDADLWPYIREVQMRVANTTDNVGLVTAVDLPDKDPQNIHSIYKRPVGKRLAYLAMDLVYGQKDYGKQSSVMTSVTRNGNVYSIRFNATALSINDAVYGETSFEVLDTEGKWVQAQARVEGDTLLVWNDGVLSPQGVRYAWANYPKGCLYNQDGLPILPFNTTKDLNTPVSMDAFTTNSYRLKRAYHLLNTGDVVINLTRNKAIRHVSVINAYVVEYTDGDIPGQAPGDQVVLLRKGDSFIAEEGTTSTIVKMTKHGLKTGDWLRNTKYDMLTEVLEVIDENTVRVSPVTGQSSGNIFEIYRNKGTVTAEK